MHRVCRVGFVLYLAEVERESGLRLRSEQRAASVIASGALSSALLIQGLNEKWENAI